MVIVSCVVKVFDETMKSVSAGFEIVRGLDEIDAVDVRDEAEGEVALAVVAQRFVGHHRPEVRAADADVHDVFDALAGVAFPLPAAHAVGEGRHLVEHRMHFRHDVLAIDDDRRSLRRAERDMQHGAVFGDVDLVAAEHRVDARAQPGFVGEFEQQLERLVGDAVLRVVEKEARGFGGEPRAALRIIGEELAQMRAADLLAVGRERLPGAAFRERFGGGFHESESSR